MIALTLTLALAGAGRVEARPFGGDLARLAWRWLTATLSGSLLPAWAPAGDTLTCDYGSTTDPDGRCVPVRTPAQDTLTCDYGSTTDPNGQCVQNPGGLPR